MMVGRPGTLSAGPMAASVGRPRKMRAAARLIAERHDAASDSALIDQAIADMGQR